MGGKNHRSTWGPAHPPTAQNVNVEMKDGLPAVFSFVDHQSVAFI